MATKKCKQCGVEIPREAKMCPHCRSKQGLKSWQALLILIFLLAVSARINKQDTSSAPGPGSQTNSPSGTSNTAANEIDFGSLLGKPRRTVEKVLGLPVRVRRSGKFRFYEYPWGSVSYTKDRFDYVDYEYRSRPSSVKEALLKVGLDESATPMREGRRPADGEVVTYFWRDDDGPPFACCGSIRISNLIINSDFSGIGITM
jgi:hypothetical protein